VNRQGAVYFGEHHAGNIREIDTGYEFAYSGEWITRPEARPVSLTLPLRRKPYHSTTMFPFFDGLIPEGWLLNIAVRNWKLDPRDRMGLLLTVCRDPIGAVRVFPEDMP